MSKMNLLEKFNRRVNQAGIIIAGVFLAAMITITCGNILTRLVWVPIRGTFELMGFFGALVTAFALGYTQLNKAHISVDILVNRFPVKLQRVLNGVNSIVCSIFFMFAGWQIARWAHTLKATGEVTETLRIVYYPFTYGVAVGCFLLALVLLVELIQQVAGRNGGR
jgi:TRAP-type C4-dicarboxylate transport system permease small subunit